MIRIGREIQCLPYAGFLYWCYYPHMSRDSVVFGMWGFWFNLTQSKSEDVRAKRQNILIMSDDIGWGETSKIYFAPEPLETNI